jgi:DinB superfamily
LTASSPSSPSSSAPGAGWLARLDAVEARLADHAAAPVTGVLTDPDPPTGERWDAGQVWAHLAEFLPYWIGELTKVVTGYRGDPVPFGRTKKDPGRIAAIEARRSEDPPALMAEVRAHVAVWRSWLAGVDGSAWSAVGAHPTLGEMDLDAMLGHFVVGHLEEHADQLDGLRAAAGR